MTEQTTQPHDAALPDEVDALSDCALPDAPLDMPNQRLVSDMSPRKLLMRLRIAVVARSGS